MLILCKLIATVCFQKKERRVRQMGETDILKNGLMSQIILYFWRGGCFDREQYPGF